MGSNPCGVRWAAVPPRHPLIVKSCHGISSPALSASWLSFLKDGELFSVTGKCCWRSQVLSTPIFLPRACRGILVFGTDTFPMSPKHQASYPDVCTAGIGTTRLLQNSLSVSMPFSFKSFFFSAGSPCEHDRLVPRSVMDVFFPTSKPYPPCCYYSLM